MEQQGFKIDRRGTLEMKLTRARAAASYARTKAERAKAAEVVALCERELAALPKA